MAGVLYAFRRSAGLILALAALGVPAVLWANPQEARAEARIREAALWRAAALQLDVIGGRRSEASRAEALAQAVAGWRARPDTIDVQAEIAALKPGALIYLSLTWAPDAARWPSDEPSGVYALVAQRELSAARIDFTYASAAGTSPGEALARAARVYGWTNGGKDMPTNFDHLDRDVAAAMARAPGATGAAPPPPPVRPDMDVAALPGPGGSVMTTVVLADGTYVTRSTVIGGSQPMPPPGVGVPVGAHEGADAGYSMLVGSWAIACCNEELKGTLSITRQQGNVFSGTMSDPLTGDVTNGQVRGSGIEFDRSGGWGTQHWSAQLVNDRGAWRIVNGTWTGAYVERYPGRNTWHAEKK